MNEIHILLIDDERMLAAIVGKLLERYARERSLRLNLVVEQDPVRGLVRAHERLGEWDAILLDLRMPKLAGDAIAESIAMMDDESFSRVLFITSHPGDLAEHLAQRSPALLTKPFRYEHLARALDGLGPMPRRGGA